MIRGPYCGPRPGEGGNLTGMSATDAARVSFAGRCAKGPVRGVLGGEVARVCSDGLCVECRVAGVAPLCFCTGFGDQVAGVVDGGGAFEQRWFGDVEVAEGAFDLAGMVAGVCRRGCQNCQNAWVTGAGGRFRVTRSCAGVRRRRRNGRIPKADGGTAGRVIQARTGVPRPAAPSHINIIQARGHLAYG